ncbi:MarR family transcriptional regulator [Rudaea sp.]|uniref:MarR family winged helix-turn-helix transcriptional regulator n=1 Tax=Rudaea sp. TaxID=2136325 RepID=UPI00321F8192
MAAIKGKAGNEHGPCYCTALRKASRRMSQLYDSALAACDLKVTQRAILAQLKRSGRLSVGALAEVLVMDSGGLAHTLKPLQRDGFIELKADPRDRRSRIVTLTALGRKKLKQSDAAWAAAQVGFEAAIGRSESTRLRTALQELTSDRFAETFDRAQPGTNR